MPHINKMPIILNNSLNDKRILYKIINPTPPFAQSPAIKAPIDNTPSIYNFVNPTEMPQLGNNPIKAQIKTELISCVSIRFFR